MDVNDLLVSLPPDSPCLLKGQVLLLCQDSLNIAKAVNVENAPVWFFSHIKTGSRDCLRSQFWIPTPGCIPG